MVWLRGSALNMALVLSKSEKPNVASCIPASDAKKNPAPNPKGTSASKSNGKSAKCVKSSASHAPSKPYNSAWAGFWDLQGFELDKRHGPANARRDRIALKVPANGCLLLCFLALAREPKILDWVEGLLAPEAGLEFPVIAHKAHSLIERFSQIEGSSVKLMKADADHKGKIRLVKEVVFGPDQSREVVLIAVPTVMVKDGVTELGKHLLPIRKLNVKAVISADALWADCGLSGSHQPPVAVIQDTQQAVQEDPPQQVAIPQQPVAQDGVKAERADIPVPNDIRLIHETDDRPVDELEENVRACTEMAQRVVVQTQPSEPTLEEFAQALRDLDRIDFAIGKRAQGRDKRRERVRRRERVDPDIDLSGLFPEPQEPEPQYGPWTSPSGLPTLPKDPVYSGCWDPGFPCRWRSGWFASCKPTRPQKWAGLFSVPDIASATLDQASKWLDRCMYVPYTDGAHVVLGSGTVVSGAQQAEKFEEGEVLFMHGQRYVVRGEWIGVWLGSSYLAKRLLTLDLAEEGLFAGCGDSIVSAFHLGRFFAKCDPQARVERPTPKVPKEQLEMKLGYSLLLERADDSCQPMAVVARTDAAMHGWAAPAMQPHCVERYIAARRSESDAKAWGYGGGSKYNWGYCYSCGAMPPGRFPGRLCAKGACLNCTKSARMATYGYQVVKPQGVVYPGVIQNVGQFPPIKASVKTMATADTLKGVPLDKEALRALPMEQQPAARLGGIGFGGVYPFSFARGAGVLGAALAYRAFRDVEINVHPEVFKHMAQYCWLLMPGFCTPKVGLPWAEEFWINSMPARRRRPLRNAREKRDKRGEPHKHYSKFKPFVKDEHALYGGVVDGMVTAEAVEAIPRTIFAPHDETHLDAGRYLKPLVLELKEVWHYENWLFYASSTPEKLDAWLNASSGAESFFCADYSAFERSHSPHSWDFMEGMYRQIYPGAEPEFWKALKAWREPSGVQKMPKFDAKIEFKAQCMNASGRDDTSLSNAVLNGMALAFSFAAALSGKSVLQVGVEELREASEKVRIAVMGDDSLVACSFDVAEYQEKILESLRLFGFVVKSFVTPNLHDVTFLGMMPYPVAGTYYWGPTIGRRMYKAFWQHDPKGNLPAWTRGTAQQLKLCACVPIVYDCACQVDAILAGKKVTKIERVTEGYGSAWTARSAPTPQYDDTTLEWLTRRYPGLTVSALKADVEVIRSVQRLPALIRLRTTDMAFATDEM